MYGKNPDDIASQAVTAHEIRYRLYEPSKIAPRQRSAAPILQILKDNRSSWNMTITACEAKVTATSSSPLGRRSPLLPLIPAIVLTSSWPTASCLMALMSKLSFK